MKIRVLALKQYLLIYIMLLIPGSCLYSFCLPATVKHDVLFTVYLLVVLCNKKYRKSSYSFILVVLLATFTLFTRLLNGGAGIGSFLQLALCIVSVHVAVSCDQDNFLNRYVRMVCCIAAVDLLYWAVFLIAPPLKDIWPAYSYLTQTVGTSGWQRFFHGKGLFLYSYLELHPTRNCGFYTEPGVHQIVLNSALFILLFWREGLFISSEKIYRRMLLIIIVAIVSCQSTTGYISFMLIIGFFLFTRHKQFGSTRIKEYTILLFLLGAISLLVDYAIRADQSIFYMQIVQKLFGESGGGLDLSAGTGQYRIGTILVSLSTIANNPLGVGYDMFSVYKDAYGSGLVAASFVSFAAVYGIIAWMITIGFIFVPVFCSQRRTTAFLFLLMFINTTLAQTELLYPAFMIIPITIMATRARALPKEGPNETENPQLH